jgi:uncharacterized repeat protein (TIGR01451 family)
MSESRVAVLALVLAGMLAPGHRPTTTRPTAPTSNSPAGLSPREWDEIRGLVQRGRYHAAPVRRPGEPSVLEASNPEQGYVTSFRREGIELASGGASGDGWRLAVRVAGYGRRGEVRPLPGAEPVADEERVEYQRGPVSEWYANRPGGLEQGFTIAEAPPGDTGGPLAIELATDGDLSLAVEGDRAAFADASGRTVVRYSELAAWDADGRALPSRMEASGPGLRLVVEAETARFPVTVDPTFVQEAKLVGNMDPDGVADDRFGVSVAVSGDTAVVGAHQDDILGHADRGSAYVFVRSAGVWSPQQKLMASDGAAGDEFGFSVAVSGDTVVVGAYLDDGTGADQGSAYVFVRAGRDWSEQRKLTASDSAPGDWFGRSVAISGETVLVGAPRDTVGSNPAQGSAYAFVRAGTSWSQQQKLTATSGAINDSFGASVALSGDTALVGAPYKLSYMGVAYVFVRSGAVWSQQQTLTASDPADDQFGLAVAVGGDTAVVGAVYDDVGANANQGSAYVFVRSSGVWSQQQKLTAGDGGANDQFGLSVAISGDTAVVGALGDDVGANANQGSAYVFVRSSGVWSQQQKLIAADGAAGDQFGNSVGVSGDNAVVGAPRDDLGANADQGSAFAFARAGAVWNQQQLTATDGAAQDSFGSAVAASGDTLVVGAVGDDVGAYADQGSAYVFVRSGGTWSPQQKLTAADGAADDRFGASVAISGDTAVVGAPADDVGANANQGSAYVFIRTGTVWSQQQKLTAADGAADDEFGNAVAASGDTAVVGAYLDDAFRGAAYVFVRSAGAWSQQQKLTAADAAAGDMFGQSVALSQDTVVVGAPQDDLAYSSMGSAYVFARAGTVWSQQQKLTAADGAISDLFGQSVGVSGDRALVGAHFDDVGANTDQGSAYLFVRAGTVWSQQQKLTALDGAAQDRFGVSVAISGGAVVAGAAADDVGANADQGSAYAFHEALADLGVTKTDGVPVVAPGGGVTYTITVANAGPHGAAGALVSDVFPAALTCSTTCAASGGATCTAGPFAGNISDTVSLPAAAAATYTSACTVSLSATGTIVNTATITAPSTVTDPDLSDNAATDTDTVLSTVSIGDAAVVEGDSGATYAVFTVSIVPPPVGAATVDFATAGSSATSGVDFTPTSGRLTFPSGASSPQTVSVPVLGDVEVEDDEVFFVDLTNPANAAITDAQGRGTIVNDDFPPPPTAFFTVTPCRIVDTRNAAGPTGGPALAPSSIRSFPLTGGPCGIPSTAVAVSVNLTAVGAVTFGHLTLFAGDGLTPPPVSTINFAAGVTRANNAIVPLATDGSGTINVRNGSAGSVHFVLDVNGYFQ